VNIRVKLAVSSLICSMALPAFAQDDASRSSARRMATEGVEALQRDDLPTAVDKLERAYQVLQAPSIGLWLARALAKRGQLVAASERYMEVGRLSVVGDAVVQASAKKEAAAELEALLPTIPSITVTLDGAERNEVAVTLDGVALSSALIGEPRLVDPGSHHVEARRGEQTVTADVTLAVSENKTAPLRFKGTAADQAAPASPLPSTSTSPPATETSASHGSGRKVLAWSAIGLGAAGIATGALTGIVAMAKKGDLEDSPDCVDRMCLRSTMQSELDSYGTLRTISSVGFIAGGVLAATGVVLLVTTPSDARTTGHLQLRVGPSRVWAEGRF
jgi:hypothetical protein